MEKRNRALKILYENYLQNSSSFGEEIETDMWLSSIMIPLTDDNVPITLDIGEHL